MTKLLFRFFISLYVLTTGYSQLHAATHEEVAYRTAQYEIEHHHTGLAELLCDNGLHIKSASTNIEQQHDKINPNDSENEENELTSSKKSPEVSKYFLTAFSARAPGKQDYGYKLSLPLCKQAFYSTTYNSPLYIVFRVFRI